jgi:Ca2+-transporting ATPase
MDGPGPRERNDRGTPAWHVLEAAEVLRRLDTDAERGLSPEKAARLLSEHGPNILTDRGAKPPWRIVREQLSSAMVAILIAAAAVSAALGDLRDACAILAIVALNTLLGFRQEYKAEKTLATLTAMSAPTVRVRRGGRIVEIDSRKLVPGDIVFLSEGNLVPADGRILEASHLRLQEAALTGESEPVDKTPAAMTEEDLPPADRRNTVFSGTVVAAGRALAVVTATGMETELGAVARMIRTAKKGATPLQERLSRLGRWLAVLSVALVAVIFGLGLLRGEDARLLFMTAVSMAVAVVPEGLPAVVTITLSLGAQRMLMRRALIRTLPSVETLGTVTVICADKTGTLTGNRMAVVAIGLRGDRIDLAAGGTDLSRRPGARLLLACGALCNDAVAEADAGEAGGLRILGDPTERALVAAAARADLRKDVLDITFPRVGEAPFDAARRRMTTVHRCPADGGGLFDPLRAGAPGAAETGDLPVCVAFLKGAVDGLLDDSASVWTGDRIVPLDEASRGAFREDNRRMAREGMRVLGLAFSLDPPDAGGRIPESNLVFLGIAGMIDPAHPEAKTAVRTCLEAGIRPVMITGDHPLTAAYVAREVGIETGGGVLSGRDLDSLTEEELSAKVEEVSVYARMTPEHKLRIVAALKRRGHVVAMTGDGVNDAPALKKADIGVAMGRAGTDVAKEASDMVLLDDNFATIVAAVEEGRVIYDNILRFVVYILMSNLGEILVMLLFPLLGMPLPLLPLQILWINLMTDGLPALALAVEPAEKDVMRRPPLPPGTSVFGRGAGERILAGGAAVGLVSLGVGFAYWRGGQPQWQTMVFCVLTFVQMGNALALRSGETGLSVAGRRSSPALLIAVVSTILLQTAIVYLPFLREIFRTLPLAPRDIAVCIAASAAVFLGLTLDKLLRRRVKVRTA